MRKVKWIKCYIWTVNSVYEIEVLYVRFWDIVSIRFESFKSSNRGSLLPYLLGVWILKVANGKNISLTSAPNLFSHTVNVIR